MDFPSREEARVYARLQAQGAAAAPDSHFPPAAPKPPARPAPKALAPDPPDAAAAGQRFRVEKQGFENDVFDRRGIRNLIRTGEVTDTDFVSVDEAAPVSAGQVPFLKSLFKLRSTSSAAPPGRCRTHTDQLAFYKCQETGRPLCEECAQEKKFGNAVARVCAHCGGHIQELAPLA
jgi:pyruvate/2-oxoglutarate dehydrogenase complex dihydrolipoamide acyltransferase (E2) component